MKIATFNVNGIGARLPRLLEWLDQARPDVVGLQEIKTEEHRFPFAEIEAAGYHALVHGQKGFNGVAILSREPATEVTRALPGDAEDVQSRWIEAEADMTVVASVRTVAAWRSLAICARSALGLPVSARSCLIGLTPRSSFLNREKSSSCLSASAKGGQFT